MVIFHSYVSLPEGMPFQDGLYHPFTMILGIAYGIATVPK